MAKGSLLNTRTTNFLELLSNGRACRVPPYQRKRLAKYILARLEPDRSGRACDPQTDPATIEHILPENPSDAWTATFPGNLWEASIYRLGKLTLLEAALNRRVGHAEHSQKLPGYASSRYALASGIPEMAPSEWTPELLDRRQQQMAARAVHLWRSDFA